MTERADYELEKYRYEGSSKHKLFDATIRFAELAIKSLLILCGGAAVALLSFAGSRAGTDQVSLDAYALAVAYFGGSAAGAVVTAATSYLAQSLFANERNSYGRVFQLLSIGIWFASLVGFAVGVFHASDAVQKSQWKTELHCEPSAPARAK